MGALCPHFWFINNTIMEILSFDKFKLLLEADEAAPAAEPAAEPAPPADPIASTPPPPMPDLGGAPMSDPLAGATLPPDPNAPAPTAGASVFKVVFLDSEKPWHSKYADGGGVKRYKEYEISQADLDKWITDSKLDANKDALSQAIGGKNPIEKTLFDKLKAAANSNKLGKDRGDVDVDYDTKQIPSTAKLDLIFVTYK
jgi:hypothetical protein